MTRLEDLPMFTVSDPYVYVEPRHGDIPYIYGQSRFDILGNAIARQEGEAYISPPERDEYGGYTIWIASGPNSATGIGRGNSLNAAVKIARLLNADRGIEVERPSLTGLMQAQREYLYKRIESERRKNEEQLAALDNEIRKLSARIGDGC